MLKVLLVTMSAFLTVPAMASFYDTCEFKAEVLSVSSLDLLNGSVDMNDGKTVAALKVLSVKNIDGHTDCTQHKDSLHIVEVKSEDASKVVVGENIRAKYHVWDGLTPDGVVGGTTWELLFGLGDEFIEHVKILSGSFNTSSNEFVIKTSVSGGCGRHEYSLKVNPACRETFPVQCDAELIHKSDDNCDSIFEDEAKISLADTILTESYYNGAFVTIKGDFDSSVTIQIPFN